MNDFEVSVGVVVRGNRVLLIQNNMKNGLINWQFPAGKLIYNETPKNAAVREVYEETLIKSEAKEYLGYRKHPITGILIHYFICLYVSGKEKARDSREVKTLKWVNPQDLKAYIPENMYPEISQYFNIE